MAINVWDSDYPPHLVLPPNEAVEISCTAYRMVSKAIPDVQDFLASFKDPRQKNFTHLKENVEYYATSFFLTKEKAENVLKASPQAFRGKFIAKGNIKNNHGKGIINTKSKHISMWLYKDIYPEGFVKI